MNSKKVAIVWLAGIIIVGIVYFSVTYKDKQSESSESNVTVTNSNSLSSSESTPAAVSSSNAPEVDLESAQIEATTLNQTPQDTYVTISSLSKNDVGNIVTIKATVKSQSKSRDGSELFLTVADENNDEILIPIFANNNISTIFVNNKAYYFSGTVKEYNGALEVIPQKTEDIVSVILNREISEELLGQNETITARVITKYRHPEGHTFLTVKVEGTNQELEVPIFSSLNYDDSQFTINAVIEVTGSVTLYNNVLEVVPQSILDIKILEAGDDSEVRLTTVDQITEADRGKMYQVKGYIKEASENNGHVYIIFEDSETNARIKGVLFKADGNEIAGRKSKILNANEKDVPIRLLVMVDVYENELEIIIDKVYNNYNE